MRRKFRLKPLPLVARHLRQPRSVHSHKVMLLGQFSVPAFHLILQEASRLELHQHHRRHPPSSLEIPQAHLPQNLDPIPTP